MKYVKNVTLVNLEGLPITNERGVARLADVCAWAINSAELFNSPGPGIRSGMRVDLELRAHKSDQWLAFEDEDHANLLKAVRDPGRSHTPRGPVPIPFPLSPARLMLQVEDALEAASSKRPAEEPLVDAERPS